MDRIKRKNMLRKRRHLRQRKNVVGTPERPRLCVFRSLRHIYAQVIDDTESNTLVSASTLDNEMNGKISSATKREAAQAVGKAVAEKALEKGVKKVVFDRGGNLYHGRVKALADAAREGGLEF